MPQLELSPFLCPVIELSKTAEVRNTEASYGKHRMGGREVGTVRSNKKGGVEAEEKVIINLSNHQHNTDFVGRYVLSP